MIEKQPTRETIKPFIYQGGKNGLPPGKCIGIGYNHRELVVDEDIGCLDVLAVELTPREDPIHGWIPRLFSRDQDGRLIERNTIDIWPRRTPEAALVAAFETLKAQGY